MSETGDVELYEQAVALLEPGEDRMVGVVVHTDLPQYAEAGMNKLMREVGNRISTTIEAGETYLYAGEDDERFGVGQFHGRQLADDEVVWECQQLIRDGSFDLVFYWVDTGHHAAVIDALEDLDVTVVPVTENGYGET